MTRIAARLLSPILACLLAAGAAQAEQADRYKDAIISSDTLSANDLQQLTTYSGNVLLVKGTIVLRAGRLDLKRDPEGYDYGTAFAAEGKLAYFRQKREGVDEYIEGVAERIEYDGKAETVKFFNRSVLRRLVCERPADEVRGQVITYDQRADVYTASGGPQAGTPGNRVRAVLQPKAVDPSAQPADPCRGGAGVVLKSTTELENLAR